MSQFPHVRAERDTTIRWGKQWSFIIYLNPYGNGVKSQRKYKTMDGALKGGAAWVGKIQGMAGDG